MHPYRGRATQDDTVATISGYPIDQRTHRQMIEFAKAHGMSYGDVETRIAKLVEQHGAESTKTDAEIEVLLASRPTIQRTPPRVSKVKPRRTSPIEMTTR